MADTSKLGIVAAKCMEAIERDFPDHHVEAVAVICVSTSGQDADTVTRVYSSEVSYWKQLGLMEVGKDCVVSGNHIEEGDDE